MIQQAFIDMENMFDLFQQQRQVIIDIVKKKWKSVLYGLFWSNLVKIVFPLNARNVSFVKFDPYSQLVRYQILVVHFPNDTAPVSFETNLPIRLDLAP